MANGIYGSAPATRSRAGKNCAATPWPIPARCFETLRTDPRSRGDHERQHRLRGDLAIHRHNGEDLEQWEYEVTSGGRVRYVIDDANHTVWIVYASPRHPKDTDA
ncbi:hypothetical protein Acor_42860 [Acrocarpospora corrugata]|uniref:Uncharacterized protein n=1 Tax=Acrocarpospora corrugata TaxID=35763 RepID=A0A5M3W4Y1_9ACTN|nr:hypothetical protein Acor_42860 [Acrocarpospora corrugata]